MHYFNSLQQNTDGEYEFNYRTNIDATRYSVFLYSQVDGSYAASTPTFEDYGCSFPPYTLNSNNLYNPANEFTGITETTNWCPAYQTFKLNPVRLNPNNFLINKIGAINFTCFNAKYKASAFCYNGVVNGRSCAGGGNLYGDKCRSENPLRYSGFENGPRVTLISKDIVISAAHYWFLGGFTPGTISFNFIGTDNTIYTATAQDYRSSGAGDAVVFKVSGLEAAVNAGLIQPIYTINYNTSKTMLNNIPVIQSCLPKFGIDIDNMLGLLHEGIKDPSYFGASSIFNFIKIKDLLNRWNITEDCSIQDFQLNPACGDSSSPEFLLHDNKLLLIKCRSSGIDTNNTWDKTVWDTIDSDISEMEGSPRNLYTFTTEDFSNLSTNFFNFVSDDSIITLKPKYDVSVIEDTNDGENKYQPLVEFSGYTIIQNISKIDQYLFGNLYKNNYYFYSALITSLYSYDSTLYTSDVDLSQGGTAAASAKGEVNVFVVASDQACDPNYSLEISSYDMVTKNNNKMLLNSTSYNLLRFNKIKKLYENYNYKSNIVVSTNKKYYISIPLTFSGNQQSLVSELNYFYISTEKNNINKIYTSGIKTYKPIKYINDTVQLVINKQTENIFDNGDLNLELIVPDQPINVLNDRIILQNIQQNCNTNGIFYSDALFYYTLILELPANCPNVLYLCFKDYPDYAFTINVEKNNISMKKDNSFSYLKITPKQVKNESDIIKLTRQFTYNGSVFGTYLGCFGQPNFPNPEEPAFPITPEEWDDIYRNHLNLNPENYIFYATHGLFKSIKNKYEVDPKDNFDINLDRE